MPPLALLIPPHLICLFFIVFLGHLYANPSTQKLTDNKGRTIQAEILGVKNNQLTLRLEGKSRIFTIPLSTLCPEDAARLADWQPSPEKSATTPDHQPYENYDVPWPQSVKSPNNIDVDIIQEDAESNRFIYASQHYRFISDVRLSKSLIKRFAVLFEATFAYCREVPLSLKKPLHIDPKKRFDILLFEKKTDYIKNGGSPSSAGVFIRKGLDEDGKVLVPLTSLGVQKRGSGYSIDYKQQSNATLAHELTHQLSNQAFFNSPLDGWFSEGIAEYISQTPYRSGRFASRPNHDAYMNFACGFNKEGRGRNIGKKFNAPHLEKYMLMPYASFTGSQANFNYAFGLLLTYYFLHMDNRQHLIDCLKALDSGSSQKEALKKLLNGRTFEQLEEDVAKAWRKKGVQIIF